MEVTGRVHGSWRRHFGLALLLSGLGLAPGLSRAAEPDGVVAPALGCRPADSLSVAALLQRVRLEHAIRERRPQARHGARRRGPPRPRPDAGRDREEEEAPPLVFPAFLYCIAGDPPGMPANPRRS